MESEKLSNKINDFLIISFYTDYSQGKAENFFIVLLLIRPGLRQAGSNYLGGLDTAAFLENFYL